MLIKILKSNLENHNISADTAKNGPNGISCDFFILRKINDIGKPIIAAKNTETIDNGNPKTIPYTPSNFISPPPIDSFLNIKSPNSFNKNINTNEPKPFSNDIPNKSKEPITYFNVSINTENTISTSSGIIIV